MQQKDVLPNAFKGNLDGFLSRLQKVKSTGSNRWKACCPAHEDRSPSLAVRELPDGRILIHCFAGCDVYAVLKSVGMEIDDLFPEGARPLKKDSYPRERYPAAPQDILAMMAQEALVVSICAHDMAMGKVLRQDDHERLKVAANRLNEAAKFGRW